MNSLVVGVAATVILPLVAEYVSQVHENMKWLKQGGTRVMAIVTDVQNHQYWKVGEVWYRNLWNGNVVREKSWQTYYDVTAQWIHPQTKQVYTFQSKVWTQDLARKPVAGNPLSIRINLDNPRQYRADFQFSSVQTADQEPALMRRTALKGYGSSRPQKARV